MAEPFLSEIRIMSFNYPPKTWAFCNGQFLPINQNQALFSLLGTTYGGNGQTTFALPNLQGRVPIHTGNGHTLGETAGQSSVTINAQTMPAHNHPLVATTAVGDAAVPTGRQFATTGPTIYAAPGSPVAFNPTSVTTVGGSQPHENRMPGLVLNFCIALVGIFPSPN